MVAWFCACAHARETGEGALTLAIASPRPDAAPVTTINLSSSKASDIDLFVHGMLRTNKGKKQVIEQGTYAADATSAMEEAVETQLCSASTSVPLNYNPMGNFLTKSGIAIG